MKFFSKEISKKLFELECKSDSNFYWAYTVNNSFVGGCPFVIYDKDKTADHYKHFIAPQNIAFTLDDLLDDSKEAKTNCIRLFKTYDEEKIKFLRHALIDAPDQEKFILEALNGK